MLIWIIFLTLLLIADCLFLGLLILVQLPKKEAGVGLAFGSGATDALFGAGSGTALSNLTKYTATAFFLLVFLLAIFSTRYFRPNDANFRNQLLKTSSVPASPTATTTAPAPAAKSNAAPISLTIASNAPAATATPPPTNAPAAPAK